ncbi:MAG: hypothetical protein KGH74_05625, partial [Candidatus Micrarchaeota archaeon]|nr:hypothetical protein [Candidatus Micrarchaeota archaeon]
VETETVGAVEVKVRAVEEVVMVSREDTPVSAPRVVTFNPPDEARENVPVELPTATLPVLVVPRFNAPVPLGMMLNPALPEGVEIVDADPPPRLRVVVEESPKVEAVVRVAREEAVRVAYEERVRVVPPPVGARVRFPVFPVVKEE